MKIALSTILTPCLFVLWSAGCYAQKVKSEWVKVEFAGFNIETIFDVSCEAFNSSSLFKDEKTTKIFSDSRDLIKFNSLTGKFKKLARKKSFDVRGALFYRHENITTKYCFDTFGYFYKDAKFYYNKDLLIYLTDKLFHNHPKYLDTFRQYE